MADLDAATTTALGRIADIVPCNLDEAQTRRLADVIMQATARERQRIREWADRTVGDDEPGLVSYKDLCALLDGDDDG